MFGKFFSTFPNIYVLLNFFLNLLVHLFFLNVLLYLPIFRKFVVKNYHHNTLRQLKNNPSQFSEEDWFNVETVDSMSNLTSTSERTLSGVYFSFYPTTVEKIPAKSNQLLAATRPFKEQLKIANSFKSRISTPVSRIWHTLQPQFTQDHFLRHDTVVIRKFGPLQRHRTSLRITILKAEPPRSWSLKKILLEEKVRCHQDVFF